MMMVDYKEGNLTMDLYNGSAAVAAVAGYNGSILMASNMSVDEEDVYYYYEYYEYNNSVSIPLEELMPVALVYGLTLILGILGNALVIFSIAWYRRMRSVTNLFLTSLASADLMLVIICVPIKFAKWFSFTWQFGEFLCKSVHYLQDVSVLCSVLTLTIISIERYYAILHPMQVRHMSTVRRARRVIIAVWLLSFILATPSLVGRVHKEVGQRNRTGYWCVKEWSDPVYEQVYELSMLFIVLLLPLSVMTYTYASICKELWHVASTRAKLREGEQRANALRAEEPIPLPTGKKYKTDEKTRKQVIKMLVSIIVLFTVCWAPTLLDNVLVAFGRVERLHYGHLKYMRQAFALMSYFNSCVNPIVYAFMSKNFRDSFRYALCVCCCACCGGRKRRLRGGWYGSAAWGTAARHDNAGPSRVWKSTFPSRQSDSRAAAARGAGQNAEQSVYLSNSCHRTMNGLIMEHRPSAAADREEYHKHSCCTTAM